MAGVRRSQLAGGGNVSAMRFRWSLFHRHLRLTLLMLIAMGSLASSSSSAQSSDTIPTYAKGMISNRWSTDAGDSLLIDYPGRYWVVSRGGARLDSGLVEVRFCGPADAPDLALATSLILAFTARDTTSLVPACHLSGEGDPAGLELLLPPGPFGWRMLKLFHLRATGVLRFHGVQP